MSISRANRLPSPKKLQNLQKARNLQQNATGMAIQDYGLGLRVGLKDLPKGFQFCQNLMVDARAQCGQIIQSYA